MSYDAWKTRSPDDEMALALRADGEKLRALTGEDHGPFEDEPTELDLAYEESARLRGELSRAREVGYMLYGLLVMMFNRSDVSDELRDAIANNHRVIEAGNYLQPTERLEWPKF